jgi:hypothetical protein
VETAGTTGELWHTDRGRFGAGAIGAW